MNTKILKLLLVAMIVVFAFVGCEEPETIVPYEPQNHTERDPQAGSTTETHNTMVNFSECKSQQRDGDSIVSSVRYENGTLFFTHENVEFNCGIDDISVVPEIEGQTIMVTISEICEMPADCICPRDVNYSIDNINEGHYNVVVKNGDIIIYQSEIDCHDTHNTMVTYSECKAQKSFSDIATSVRYENGTLYFTHTDVELNCAIEDVSVVPEINGQAITVTISEICEEYANCVCPIDINYSIDNIKAGSYAIVVKVKGYTIYQTEIICQ